LFHGWRPRCIGVIPKHNPRREKSWQQILLQDLRPIRSKLLICGRTFACRQAGQLIIE